MGINPYKECEGCMATKWCKIYSGEVERGKSDWCSAKFRLDKALELSKLPRGYLNANLYNMEVDGMDGRLRGLLEEYAKDIIDTVEQGINFFLSSPVPGVGKTYSAMVLLNHFIYKACVTDKFDFEKPLGLFVVHADLMDDLRYRRDEDYVQHSLKQITEVPFLIIDDIGSGTSSAFSRDQTYLIVNKRVNEGLSTIYTSNLTLKELGDPDILGSRTASRISSNCVGLYVSGKDRRIKTARGVGQ